MSKISQIIRQIESNKKDLDRQNNQRHKLVEFIDTLQYRRNFASILQKDELQHAITDKKISLITVDEEIDKLHDQIEKFERELEKLSNSTSNEANTEDSEEDDYVNTEAQAADFTVNDSENYDEKESSIPSDFGYLGNIRRNYYSLGLEELKKYETRITTSTAKDNVASKSIQAIDLIKTEDPIKKTVLYVATFFPKLSRLDFERVVAFFLERKSINIPVTSADTDDKGESTKILFENKDLYSDWKEDDGIKASKIMEECHLVSVYLEDSTQAVDFKLAYLRNDLKTCFKNDPSAYLDKKFKRAKLLLFDLSVAVLKNAILLSVEMADSNPNIHGGEWLADILNLFRLFTNFEQLTARGFSTTEVAQLLFSNHEKQEEFELFTKLLNQIDENDRGEFLISRVAFLIEKMLEYPKLKPVVNNFLQQEINRKNQETVLALITLLQSVQAFDWLFWIEKLLNEKSALIGSYTRQILISQLEQSQKNIYEILIKIWSWVPREQTKKAEYTQAQIYALRLIYKYSRILIDKLQLSDYGCYPPKYQLFASLSVGDRSTDEKLKLLVDWVFHPGHKDFVKVPMKEASRLIADWFSILCGLDTKKESNPNLKAIADKLLMCIIFKTDGSQQQELIEKWNELTEYKLDQAERASNLNRTKMQKLYIQQKNSIRQLRKNFKELQQLAKIKSRS
ncbi:MAG: hypothetical protein RMZ41_002790 [Nostoc sp. DedVER02]|uniref:hypothetical protein n=1 Tax=unclassified Nostoc TaxID=2593658 RepID=UPI002AD564FC|nr:MULTISPECIES: hypothetical protein [unclassified Nostoc]MDZ7986914.1 hypothetical protein [Nostoc sp. DedVER02]MDZ8115816.1 hypothetical protein [Nostoc sp. DedVER01b]